MIAITEIAPRPLKRSGEFSVIRNPPDIIPPPDGEIILLPNVCVEYGLNWKTAAGLACGNSDRDPEVERVESLYVEPKYPSVSCDFICLRYLVGRCYLPHALNWARQGQFGGYVLELTTPRQVFAIGALYDDLHHQLPGDRLAILYSTKTCRDDGFKKLIGVRWNIDSRTTFLDKVPDYSFPFEWFVFLRKAAHVFTI